MRNFPLLAAAGMCLGLFASGSMAEPQGDLSYRSALYDYHLQRYQPAQITLLTAEQKNAGLTLPQQMLMARVYVQQLQFEDAREVFSSLNVNDIPVGLRNDVLFSLAKLYHAENRCKDALSALDKIGQLPSDQDAEARFIEVSCIIGAEEFSVERLRKGEQVLRDGLRTERSADLLIWFSYAYYNLAVASANINQLSESDRLYQEALRYTGANAEGMALAEKIRLSRASVNYALNRYQASMAAYKELPFNGSWRDEALLGYGWAAFRNYQSDIAIEAWRQLVDLPFKSLSVYQGYLAIPYALERASAFSQALADYENAIKQFNLVTDEIDQLSDNLTAQKINEHAVHYFNKKGEVVQPLHPLLASTYAQPEFLRLIEQIGTLTGYKQQLAAYEQQLALMTEYRNRYNAEAQARLQWRSEQQVRVTAELGKIEQSLPALVNQVLAAELSKPDAPVTLRDRYQQYAAARRSAESLPQGSQKTALLQRLNRLQGVLLMQVAERKQPYIHAAELNGLVDRYQTLLVRFGEFNQLAGQTFPADLDDAAMAQLRQRMQSAGNDADGALLQLQEQLLQKTRDALAEQRRHLEIYKNKARIASANLREEFYQRGGSRLWY